MSDLRTLLSGPISDGQVLSSTFQIENILLLIEEIAQKLDYYKELKKHRIESIDEKISSLSQKEATLRGVILNTMKNLNEKSLDFPDIGKVTRRKSKPSIVLDDQSVVVNYLEKKGLKDQIIKVTETLDKRKLNSVIGDLEKQGETIPGVSKTESSESLSITFEKPNDPNVGPPVSAHTKPELDLDDLDALVV